MVFPLVMKNSAFIYEETYLLKTALAIVKDVVKYFATLLNYVTVLKKLTLIITSLFLPFTDMNKESFGQGCHSTDLLSSDPEKKSYPRNLV